MTKEEFYNEMLRLKDEYEHRPFGIDDLHLYADRALCECLTELGYGDGVKIFEDLPKWYA